MLLLPFTPEEMRDLANKLDRQIRAAGIEPTIETSVALLMLSIRYLSPLARESGGADPAKRASEIVADVITQAGSLLVAELLSEPPPPPRPARLTVISGARHAWEDWGHESFVNDLCATHGLKECAQDFLTWCDTWELYILHSPGPQSREDGGWHLYTNTTAQRVGRAELAAWMRAQRSAVRHMKGGR